MLHVGCAHLPNDAGHEYANIMVSSLVKATEVELVVNGEGV